MDFELINNNDDKKKLKSNAKILQ
ncbi:unnamed protein product, partial [Rotaria sordida]